MATPASLRATRFSSHHQGDRPPIALPRNGAQPEIAPRHLPNTETMKTKLERLIERVVALRDAAHDDELSDELDNAILHLEAASDRLVQMEEEEEENDPLDDGDHAYDTWKDEQLTG